MSRSVFQQQLEHQNGPHQPDCPCRGPGEDLLTYRRRLRNESTAKMAAVRGGKYNKIKDNGRMTDKRFGSVVLDTEPQGLAQPYATQNFSAADLDAAIKKYGQWGEAPNKGYGVVVQKIIGAGRFGIIALVHCLREGGVIVPCVLKLEKHRHHVHGTLAREEFALKKFKGARHILKILDLTEEIKEARFDDSKLYAAGRQPEREAGDEDRDERWHLENFAHQPIRNFIFVEHAAQGDLNMWLSKASRSGTRWPVRAIWMLFKSLTQGLVGMGYPPQENFGGPRSEWDPNDSIDENLPDDFPMSEMYQPQSTTHFDLEPGNVLASSSMENGNMPVFKIADFGSVQFFSQIAMHKQYFDKELFWKCRFSGKGNYFAPEQFTRQWDFLDVQTHLADDNAPNPFVAEDGTKPPLAGNYGMHTNVFQVGVIIWCAITLCAFKPLTAAIHTAPNGREVVTWGGALQHERFDNVDKQLKCLVQRCMADEPASRPSLGVLMRTIEDRLGANDLESEEAVAYWAHNFFSSPQSPRDNGPKREFPGGDGDDDDEDAKRYAPRLRTEARAVNQNVFQEPAHALNLLNQPVGAPQQGAAALQPAAAGYSGPFVVNNTPTIDPRILQISPREQMPPPVPPFGGQQVETFTFGGDQVIQPFGMEQGDFLTFGGNQMQQSITAANFQPGGYFNVNAQYGENPFQPPMQQQQQQQMQQQQMLFDPMQYMLPFNQPVQPQQNQPQQLWMQPQQQQPFGADQNQGLPEDDLW
ncbi:hypothetical protein CTA2_11664 [Colletotrichum tanaceti]|uniref:Protein kinase domain-containing protein n=1 Tax=Colletotrichum tanaceti TaxID=1306861 RepID=A0A4U6XQZ5_9PEZI|nr:hypothetical protein CTA2_11657 [Colletotrichum tanaceti]KAJ0167967.1 hypothetical protein CTA2_11664 [Colletotrichum tanaceti]TKW58285.1 hypothetical protein CTA1_12089 [Colletotrichum tanaceti]